MAAVLASLPNVTQVGFELVVFTLRAEDSITTPLSSLHRRTIDSFTLRRCIVKDDHSFYQLFPAIKRIATLTLDHVRCMESPVRYPTFPDDFLQIDAIHMTGLLTRAIEPLKGFFRNCRSHTPLRLSLSITSHHEDDMREGTFLAALKNDVTSLSANVLGAICTLEWMADGLPPGFEPGVPPRVDLTGCTALTHLVLFFTTTNAMRGHAATRVYTRIFGANAMLLLRAPTSLRRIELRFQRRGPYVRHSVGELRAIDDSPGCLWKKLDTRIVERFPRLEELVCVLCDEQGFLEQFQSLGGKAQHVSGQYSRQVEFDDYVGWLKTAFPRLHERGLLRFEMSSDR
ncbi:hypothetical protein C8Q80DRAFT_1275813 [Daedaleopsis nitida]|nr:hypothetical protein C8Q80DRAFT_1275813 [Daedaleopsis nitida]